MQPKILMVHDQEEVPERLLSRLEREGFQVVLGSDPAKALEIASTEKPDVVILDLRIPVLDEVEICRRIRRASGSPLLPVLILKGEVDAADKVIALEHGVDELLLKPYDPLEVVARIRSFFRWRPSLGLARRAKAGVIEMDLDRHEVTVSGKPLKLTLKEFTLLEVLLQAAGRVVRREDLLEKAWGYPKGAGIESRTLDVHIRSLRKKLGAEAKHIVTVRKVGYLLDVAMEWIDIGRDPSRRDH